LSECPSSYLQTVLNLANGYRSQNGVAPLQMNGSLQQAARQRSIDQAVAQVMSHNGWVETIQRFYPAPGAENIAAGQTTPESAMSAWWNSEGHRNNILNGSYHDSGVGCIIGSNGVYFWTHDFGFGA